MTKYGEYEIPDDVDNLSNIAEQGMDICGFVEKWGTVGSSLVFSEAIKKSDLSDESKGMAYNILANLQKSLKDIRKAGSCKCKIG